MARVTKQRTYAEEGGVLQGLDAQLSALIREDQIADRHAAGVESHDEVRTVPVGMKARARFT
jgi:hypothetical protein